MKLQLSEKNRKDLFQDIAKLMVVALFINFCQSITSDQELFNDKTLSIILQGSMGLIIYYVFVNKYVDKLAN
ncbi:hypothetical protein CPAV1605_826 [seawater metagenome]|uniref:Uncharacterized protein n=1 Tax=seawater metagenome TaxID=1561972 RepID=A0A5E8CIQ5_9ZZZZ